ncbi:HesB/YadR/YfhF family protein [Staphylococcus auricularis]|uniref:HesB/YadR/YfhF family protein n=1 Tax=Staphylococcus auricularis TaxID=29379 RepID=UPI003EBC5018
MKIDISSEAVNWFKEELDLPQDQKVLVFYVRYGGEFQLKQGFSPAFSVEDKQDIEIGYENEIEGLTVVVAEKDLWYFEDDALYIDIDDGKDEIAYSTK